MSEACCTCASLLSSIPPTYDEKTEKPTQYERRLECCSRAICARCITDNPRFANYCPFCQVSIVPSPLPQGLRDPPEYSPPTGTRVDEQPPPYSAQNLLQPPQEKPSGETSEDAPDVLHFVDPNNDSMSSLSLRYGVPISALRATNGLYADHLLAARRTLLIPGEYYKGGVSLSPRPLEGEEEEIKRGKVRKFMVGCKVVE
jgi:LysM repeat protein